MQWHKVNRMDQRARKLADQHYSRQTPGSPHFTQPGRTIVLLSTNCKAVWVSSWPYPQYVHRAYPDAWTCSLFRNTTPQEPGMLSSELITQAVAATRAIWGEPPATGMVTMVDAKKTKAKPHPGYCYRVAGFQHVGFTGKGLYILQLLPENMPKAAAPIGLQLELIGAK